MRSPEALTPVEGEDPPPRSVQEQADRLEKIILAAAGCHIPRGARADPRPWALDPELEEAVRERRSARSALRPDDPASRDRWIAAKKAAADHTGDRAADQAVDHAGSLPESS